MIDSRPLLSNGDKLRIILDSQSMEQALKEGNENVERLIYYQSQLYFEYIRTPFEASNKWLRQIQHFDIVDPKTHHGFHVEIKTPGHLRRMGLGTSIQEIEMLTRYILRKDTLSALEKESALLVFYSHCLNRQGHGIFVTDNHIILRMRKPLEARHSCKLNILTIEESLEIMDLFTKKLGIYSIFPEGEANPSYWYKLSFMSMVPQYREASRVLDAFESRFRYLLMSVDKIGIQYFTCTIDSIEEIIYHFNYFISLTTGIFDNLAIETKDKYTITFIDGEDHPSRISLRNKDFLKEIRRCNLSLREHISKNLDFINLVYAIRELVIHREGLEAVHYEYNTANEKWKNGLLIIPSTVAEAARKVSKVSPNETIGELGVYSEGKKFYLEPYRFARCSTKLLAAFCNVYLKCLNLKGTISPSMQQDIDEFRKWSLVPS